MCARLTPLSLLDTLPPGGSNALLARLLAIGDDAIVVADDAQRIVVFNDGAERIFGHRAADVLGQPLALLLPEPARDKHTWQLAAFAGSARTARRMAERREIQGRRADGSLFDAEASIAHMVADGRTWYTAIVRDVSEQRAQQRALAASEARFRTLAASAPVGIFQADAEGLCCYVNPRWCEIAGMSPSEAQGRGWLRALHPMDRAGVIDAWQRAVTGGTPFSMRYRFVRADGEETWVMGNAVPAPGSGGASDWIGTVTDVSDSQRQALALERAKSEAEAAARAKSLFLANMSHEIRTPLNAVVGMTTLLLDTPMSEDQRDFARTIRASSDTLLEIINDILDYSKADVGKLEIEEHPFDLRQCVEASLDLVAPRAVEKGLNLAYLIEEGTPEALIGDATRIRQVLVNLLSNAVKFTHQGEVFVAVEGRALDEHTLRLRVGVKDTGIGIAAEQLPRLFQSFTQVDASTTRKYGGTGLGLAISKRLVELMGGGVSVQSEPGQGSLFGFDVLVRRTAAEPPEFLQRHPPALAGRRILIVDDNQTNRRILTKWALLWGMLPSTLATGPEAMDLIRHGEAFDAALLDMSMPEYDGLDLATDIRRRRTHDELPIVLLTSLGQRQALQATRELQLAACLGKPIKASVLFATLVAVMGGQTVSPQQPAPAGAPRAAPALALRVLVAEDNAVNQRVTRRLLQHLGHRTAVAANGREAVEAARRERFDVVLMDIQMPELDGVQAARMIVAERGAAALPRIIAMTANAMPGDREAYIDAGMDGYLSKPIDLQSLAGALERVAALAREGAREALSDVVDTRRLEHLRGMQDESQPQLVRELIDLFTADSPAHARAITEAHARGDAEALRSLAHRFLSATENIGALRLSQLCAEIERLARAEALAEAAPLLGELETERERAAAALEMMRLRY